MMTPSERIKFMRQQQGWTQEELGKATETSQQALHQYEKGIRSPGADLVNRLAKAFNSSSFLIDESNWSYVPLKTNADITGLLIQMIKRGIITVDGKRKPLDSPIEVGTMNLYLNRRMAELFLMNEDYHTPVVPKAMRKSILYTTLGDKQANYSLSFANSEVEQHLLTWYSEWEKGNYDQADRYELKFATNLR